MKVTKYLLALLVLSGVGSDAWADDPADIDALEQQLQQLREQYDQRLHQLEERIDQLKQHAEDQGAAAVVSAPPVAPAPVARNANSFNPAIALILQGKAIAYSRNPENYSLRGFQLGGEAGLADEGPNLSESELTASANIDDRFYGQATISFSTEDGEGVAEVEEAFVEAPALPWGLGLKFGRFFTEVGYQNTIHSHAWDFADEPLTQRAFLGGQFGDDGVQLRWLAPTDLFVEFGAEALRGDNFPGGKSTGSAAGTWNLFAHVGGDVGISNSWKAGLSWLTADVDARDSGISTFSGDSDLFALHGVWKWAPNGNPAYRNLVLQGEFFYRDENGVISVDDGLRSSDYDGQQYGWYAQAAYQFRQNWRAGMRYDRLWSDNDGNDNVVLADAGLDDRGHDPHRWSLMLDYSHSEFSRLRLQYNRDESRAQSDNQWTLQYIMSLGAHGAHRF